MIFDEYNYNLVSEYIQLCGRLDAVDAYVVYGMK